MDIMINDKEDEIIKEHFWSPLSRCQIEFKKSLKVLILCFIVLISFNTNV